MKIYFVIFLVLLLGNSQAQVVQFDSITYRKALKLVQKYAIVDGHVDLPYRLKAKNFRLPKEYLGIPYKTDEGDFDYIRARKGGLDAPFMSIYIPSSFQKTGGAKELADSLINMVEYIAKINRIIFKWPLVQKMS